MADKLINLLLLKLKVLVIIFTVALAGLLSVSFTTSGRMADDMWKQLGMTKVQGTDGIKNSFINGYLDYYGARNARNIATGNRAGIAKDLLTYTKQYINSPLFKKEYEKFRKDGKPEAPEYRARHRAAISKDRVEETQEQIKRTEEIMKKPDMKKIMEPSYEMLKKNLVELKDTNSKMINNYWMGEQRDYEQSVRSYNERYANWEKNYPENINDIIKARLQKYLDLANTVDFNAELKQVGKKQKFVNPAYEGKSYDWKMIFRAGKEVYEVTKPFAEQWIKELSSVAKN
jgi:hypothetical protein